FDITEDDSTTSPPRISGRFFYNGHPAAYQITAVFLLVPDTTILETAHDRLAHRGLSDFGMPSIAHASHTNLAYQRLIMNLADISGLQTSFGYHVNSRPLV
ncbi:hypothetical protein T05_5337, partial [Trichinella murrelli]